MKKFVGAHVSASGGVENAPLNAHQIGAKAFALFTKNQRQWNAAPLTEKSIQLFKERITEYGYQPKHILPHDSYLINLGNFDQEKRNKSLDSFIDEARRTEQLGLHLLNFHPGSHLREINEQECLDLIIDSLNKAIDETEKCIFVIENTAGQGSNLGYRFEHLGYLIKNVKDSSRMGVCIDTCHAFSAGYDLKSADGYIKTFEQFDQHVGKRYLLGMHLNDSKTPFESRKDRHAPIGEGTIGSSFFERMMKDSRFDDIPLILETPNSENWDKEIKYLYNFLS